MMPFTGNVVGVGTDIVAIARIREVYEKHPQNFLEKILGVEEQKIFHTRLTGSTQRAVRYLALRYAAKEAFMKACGTGLREPMTWHGIQILNNELGAPYFMFSGSVNTFMQEKKWQAHISLSDEESLALAFVVLLRD